VFAMEVVRRLFRVLMVDKRSAIWKIVLYAEELEIVA
jgi:hypothetical protein